MCGFVTSVSSLSPYGICFFLGDSSEGLGSGLRSMCSWLRHKGYNVERLFVLVLLGASRAHHGLNLGATGGMDRAD